MGRELTTPFHLIPTLRVGGAIPLLPLYAYIACRGTFTFTFTHTNVGRDNSVGIEPRYGLQSPGIGSLWVRDFQCPTRPALGPTLLLLYNGYRG